MQNLTLGTMFYNASKIYFTSEDSWHFIEQSEALFTAPYPSLSTKVSSSISLLLFWVQYWNCLQKESDFSYSRKPGIHIRGERPKFLGKRINVTISRFLCGLNYALYFQKLGVTLAAIKKSVNSLKAASSHCILIFAGAIGLKLTVVESGWGFKGTPIIPGR